MIRNKIMCITAASYRTSVRSFRGNCLGNCRGRPWAWLVRRSFATDRSAARPVAISADFRGNRRVSEDSRGNDRGRPWKLLRLDVRGNLRDNCHGLPWVVMVGTTPWQFPWKCHEPWHLPWKPANFNGIPWQHPRKSTEAPWSLLRTSAKMSNNVNPCQPLIPSRNLGPKRPGAANPRAKLRQTTTQGLER